MRRSRTLAVTLLAGLGLAAAASEPSTAGRDSQVQDSSHILPSGERILEQSIVVPAPVEEVWAAFTSSEGFASWAAPVAAVDFRLGGLIESSYRLGAQPGDPGTIRNEIVAYLPHRMLALRNVQAPPGTRFDVATFQGLHSVVLLERTGAAATRVTIAQPGYRSGEPYDEVYRQFEWGNRWSLEKLRERFESGPIDWQSLLGDTKAAPESR